MIRLLELKVDNFLSFGEGVQIDLADRGLVCITGENRDSSASNSNGAGKCLPGTTPVFDPAKKEIVPLQRFVEERREQIVGFSGWDIKPVPVVDWHELGEKELVSLRLSNGVEYSMAATHPVLTPSGCVQAGKLVSGEFVGEMKHLDIEGQALLTNEEACLLGLLIGDGCLSDGTIKFSCKDRDVLTLFSSYASSLFPYAKIRSCKDKRNHAFASSLSKEERALSIREFCSFLESDCGINLGIYTKKGNVIRMRRGDCSLAFDSVCRIERDYGVDLYEHKQKLYPSRMMQEWASRLGVLGKTSFTKEILPEFLWLDTEATGHLLAGLWLTDGYIAPSNKELSYTTANLDLAKNVRFLLQRIGVVSSLRHKYSKEYDRTYYTVAASRASFSRFQEVVPLVGKKKRCLDDVCKRVSSNPNVDIIPPEFCKVLSTYSPDKKRHRTQRQLEKHGMSREMFKGWGGDPQIANAPITWVKVASVEFTGDVVPCYDITVGTEENLYIADGLVVHNSSIFESIYYSIYGKTLRPGRMRLDETIRRGVKSGNYVSLTFMDEKGRILRIRRYRKNKQHGDALYFEELVDGNEKPLGGQDKDDTQAVITGVVGMSDSLFRQIVLFGEGGMTRFSVLSDSDKKKLIEEILGLHVYEQAGKLARETMGNHLERKGKARSKLEGIKGHLLTAEKRASDLVNAREEWQKTRDNELRTLQSEIDRLEKVKDEIAEIDPKMWVEQKKEKEVSLAAAREELQGIHKRERLVTQGYMQKRDEITKRVADVEAKKKYLDKEFKHIDMLIFNGICPTCKQPTKDLDRGRLDQINKEFVEIRKEEGVLEDSRKNLEAAKRKVSAGIETREGQLYVLETSLVGEMNELSKSIVSFSEKSSSLELLSRLEKRHQELLSQEYPHLNQQGEASEEVVTLRGQLDGIEKQVEQAEQMANKYRILNDVFRLIRSFVFESFSEGLNKSLREYCQVQNNGSLSASIRATSETAKGEIREKISIQTHNPTGGDTYSSCSVGEKRRLDLPIAFALQDFSAKRGLGIGMSLLDEMFEAVDEVGKQGIFNLLNTIVSREHTPSVFVVTHSESLKPLFSSFLNVVKENGVSSIQ